MVWWCLGCFGVVLGVLGRFGYFEAVGFQKKKFSALCTVMFWWGWFWVVVGVSMDRTTAMLTDQIRKRVCLQIHGQFCLAL